MTDVPVKKNSDLGVRIASAAVMLAVAIAAFALGGIWLKGFVAAVAFAGFVEFAILAWKAFGGGFTRALAHVSGALYFGLAAWGLATLPSHVVAGVVALVIATDSCAYFAGRAIGGPKIAPAISPSKTWAGLAGGMSGAAIVVWLFFALTVTSSVAETGGLWKVMFDRRVAIGLPIGAGLAVAAQAGDFFESWIKRRAGAKDSSSLIPGHGGVFDRIDGLVPVSLIVAFIWKFLL